MDCGGRVWGPLPTNASYASQGSRGQRSHGGGDEQAPDGGGAAAAVQQTAGEWVCVWGAGSLVEGESNAVAVASAADDYEP